MEPLTTDPVVTTADLDRATHLREAARRSTRWYSHYLVVFGVASFGVAVLTGTLDGPSGVALTMGLWAAFLAVSTAWVARRRTAIQGMTRLHLTVMACWTVTWAATVILGKNVFDGQLWWWVLGGLAVAAGPLVGAVVAHRRTA